MSVPSVRLAVANRRAVREPAHLMHDILLKAWAELRASSPLEQAATVLGVAGVWLMIRQSLWTFPISLVQVAIFGWVCFDGLLYSETALQVMYFVALIYGWAHWKRTGGKNEKPGPPIRWLPWRERLGLVAATLAVWGAWGLIMRRLGAALPWADAFVFSTSVAAQILQTRKNMDNWPCWLITNTVGVWVFWRKEFYWFMVLYTIFWLMALGGWREWHRAMKTQTASHA